MSDDGKNIRVQDQQVIRDSQQQTVNKAELEESRSAQDYGQASAGGKLTMAVKVYSPYRDYYDGQAFSISGENLTGPFDVLPKHHSFISLLSPCDLIIRTPKEQSKGPIKIRITGGLLHVKANQVIVFLDI